MYCHLFRCIVYMVQRKPPLTASDMRCMRKAQEALIRNMKKMQDAMEQVQYSRVSMSLAMQDEDIPMNMLHDIIDEEKAIQLEAREEFHAAKQGASKARFELGSIR